jgi:hypothetical protein
VSTFHRGHFQAFIVFQQGLISYNTLSYLRVCTM